MTSLQKMDVRNKWVEDMLAENGEDTKGEIEDKDEIITAEDCVSGND